MECLPSWATLKISAGGQTLGAVKEMRKKEWIKETDEGRSMEDQIQRASPWHHIGEYIIIIYYIYYI